MARPEVQPLQGMSDITAPEVRLWQWVESRARQVFRLYGCEEIRTPIPERTEVFVRALGEGTDVVQKEMYAFTDRGGRGIALRPEGTAGVMRYVAGAVAPGQDARLYYLGPMFRAERPQAGRKRQFHQIGVEFIGSPSPVADAECIALQVHLMDAWGLSGYDVQVHTRGLTEDQPAVRRGFQDHIRPRIDGLCEDCRRRFETHPLRILDCKQETCRGIVAGEPPVTTYMSDASRAYLDEVMRLLEAAGVGARINPLLIRGLDYYAHTIWEITHPALGAQDALAGGGRYRIAMAGRDIEGVGFAVGLERVLIAVQASPQPPSADPAQPIIWIVTAGGDASRAANLGLLQKLRRAGVSAGMDTGGRSMKAQMRAADRSGAAWVAIRGEEELAQGHIKLKRMADGSEDMVSEEELTRRLGNAALS